MHVHFLGICGTFMASLAVLAKQQGHTVTGQDTNIYPPMSTQLANAQIDTENGFAITAALQAADVVVVGNVMKRGMPAVEYLLENKRELISGPEFLAKHIMHGQHTLVVAGTHGKTTTTSMLAWILTHAGLNPGYLIGGVPKNFEFSAALGAGKYFVLEGDEYDCAFFDKRSKFIHYRPNTLIVNNLEYDHADIFKDLAAIQTQFHHMIRTIPSSGTIIVPQDDTNVAEVINMGCWSKLEKFGVDAGDWQLQTINHAKWQFFGKHNCLNAVAAIAAAHTVGVKTEDAIAALSSFAGIKRRLELIGTINDICVYDDFAHHPTAIKVTLEALSEKIAATQKELAIEENRESTLEKPQKLAIKKQGATATKNKRVIAVIDICSNTMRAGTHQHTLGQALAVADKVYFYHDKPIEWNIDKLIASMPNAGGVCQQVNDLVAQCVKESKPGDQVVLMSNGAFAGIHAKLLTALGTCTK